MPSDYSLGPKITLPLTTKLETPLPFNPTPYLLDILVGCVAFLPQLEAGGPEGQCHSDSMSLPNLKPSVL